MNEEKEKSCEGRSAADPGGVDAAAAHRADCAAWAGFSAHGPDHVVLRQFLMRAGDHHALPA